jgi:hypothetical protein
MGKRSNLEAVIYKLHSSDIRIGLQTFKGGILIWIGDPSQRVRSETVFEDASLATIDSDASQWLHATALRLFPDSKYAVHHRRKSALLG